MTANDIVTMIKENHRLERIKRDLMTQVELVVQQIANNKEKLACWEYQRDVDNFTRKTLRIEEC